MINKNDFILALYTYKLFGESLDKVYGVLSQKLGLNKNQVSQLIINLSKKGIVEIKDNIITNAKKYNLNNLQQNSLVLGVVNTDGRGYYYFKPSNDALPEIPLVATDIIKNSVGKRCCCELNKLGKNYQADLKQVFGEVDDPISENIAIAYKYGFEKHFSPDVMAEVENIPQAVLPSDFDGRIDMRDKFFMTWDPASCKDKDDAIFAEQTEFGHRVYVAIADVSHYVKFGTKLDTEARKRGTSCYLGSGVYPMLPPELSNGICSLNENVDRLALVATIDINEKGKIQKYNFEKAVINVKKSFSYEDAEKVFLKQDGFDQQNIDAKKHIDLLYEVTDILESKLKNRGSLNFVNYEPEFKFNQELNIVEDIETTGLERSHKVVEQCMILANEATAKFFTDNNLSGIYRVHNQPNHKNLSFANDQLKKFGVNAHLEETPFFYQSVLNEIKDLPNNEYLNNIILQTLNKAKYNAENTGHFGLASKGYTHFTSPIRRYSDTIAHRIISQFLTYGKSKETESYIKSVCEHLNEQEKKAGKAENESNKYLCCLWAKNHLNKVISGYVTRVEPAQIVVRHKGLEVQIPTYLLKNGANSNYQLSKDLMSLKDKHSNTTYTIGDSVDFKIADIDKNNYTIFATTDLTKDLKNEDEFEFNI